MGYRDKAFLKIKGKYFIEHILDRVNGFADILVVSNNPEKYEKIPVRVVEDEIKGAGPLGGIYTGLFHSTQEEILVISCDTPLLDKKFIEYMGKLKGDYDAVIPLHGGRREPLCALYTREVTERARALLDEKRYKVAGVFSEERTLRLDMEKILSEDEIEESFSNFNYIEEFKEAGGEL